MRKLLIFGTVAAASIALTGCNNAPAPADAVTEEVPVEAAAPEGDAMAPAATDAMPAEADAAPAAEAAPTAGPSSSTGGRVTPGE